MTNKNVFSQLLGLSLVAVMATGCKQNPFPTTGGRIVTDEEKPDPVTPAFSVEVEQMITCEEGKSCSTTIVGRVPNNGHPILRIDGLPPGAVYDTATNRINYTPGFDVVDIAQDPTQPLKSFTVTAVLRSDTDTVTAYRKQFVINVKNVYRPITVALNQANMVVKEGVKLTQLIDITSPDFPNGPFTINLKDQPSGVTVTQVGTNGRQFKIEYVPSNFLVTVTDPTENGRYVKKFNVGIVATAPSGFNVTQVANWTIQDDRLSPFVSAPIEVRQGPDVNFTIRAEDLNGERPPVIQVNTNVPFGRLTAQAISTIPARPGVTLPSSLFDIHWDQIPPEHIGETHNITAMICGPATPTRDSICVNNTVRVVLSGNVHLAPIVNRVDWPVSRLKYAKVGTSVSFPVSFADAEIATAPLNVQILPAAMASQVSYANGQLTIRPTAEGLQQFSVKVTSQFQQSIVEGFLFDALPAAWSDTVILTGADITPEVTKLKTYVGSGDILSAAFQLNERNLQMRSRLIVTTAALSQANAIPAIEAASRVIQNIIVLSPLGGGAGGLATELGNLGAVQSGRLTMPVTQFLLNVDSSSQLDRPHLPMSLAGTTTSESPRPFLVNSGADRRCQKLFSLQKQGSDLAAGVACKRASGGVLSVVGFEFSDLLVDDTDRATVTSWIQKLSTARGIVE